MRFGPLSRKSKQCAVTLSFAAAILLAGCDNAVQGGATGAGLGALSGLAIGSLSGNAGKGAVIGAVAGGVGGAVLGDQNRRASERNASSSGTPTNPPPQSQNSSSLTQTDRDRLALARFARSWRVTGWETVDGQRRLVSGTATGTVENSFFIRLTTQIRDDQSGNVTNGNIVFASEPGRGMTMNSHFDSGPTPMTFDGSLSADGNVLTLNEIAPAAEQRVIIRFINDGQWVADTTNRSDGSPRSSLNFTASN